MRRLAPRMLIFAWAAFWLSGAFLPCHDAIAAVADEPSGDALPIVVTSHLTHGEGATQVLHSNHTSHFACENPAKAAPASTGSMAKQVMWHPSLKWAASYAPFPALRSATNVFDNLAPHWIPPPQYRFYARTLRILI